MRNRKSAGLIIGLIVFFLVIFLPTPEGLSNQGKYAIATTLLMMTWWITEAIPIYATAFVPLAIFPLLGILPADKTAANYGHNFVLMLLGGFFLAKAIEIQNLHKRIALLVISKLGTSRRKIILSFMLATAFLSMWIANVAVTLLMLPIAVAIMDKEESESGQKSSFGLALMLAIAYAASVGGTASLIGTPPNLVFVGVIEKLFPEAPGIDFLTWLKIGIPVILIFLPVIWLYITKFYSVKGTFSGSKEVVEQELNSLGPIQAGEKKVLYIFILTAFGWVFRKDFEFGDTLIPGWSSLLGVAEYVHDSTVAFISAMLLFILPACKNGPKLLDWKSASSVPWGVVMIVGGGYAIAESFSVTGLALWIGEGLTFLNQFSLFWILVIVVFFMVFLTEINSNTATANIFLPILGTMAIAGQMHPYLLMIPATFACSFSFMLPSGTGVNAVVFGSNRVTIPEMARCGIGMNLISVILLTLLLYLLVIPILGIGKELPIWAY